VGAAALVASPWFVTGEDYLRVEVLSVLLSYPVAIHWRMLLPNGRIQVLTDRLVSHPTVPRQTAQKDLGLGEGLLLNVGLVGAGASVQFGQLFGRVTLNRGRDAASVMLGTLLSDYISRNWGIGWPGSPIRSPQDQDHTAIYYTQTSPGAGAELIVSVPTAARWELLSWQSVLTTSAVAGDRTVLLVGDDGATLNGIFQSPNPKVAPASSAIRYNWAQGLPLTTLPLPAVVTGMAGLPMGLSLTPGSRFRTSTQGFLAGDVWGDVRFYVRETISES
jgi:hypothetical protein